MNKNLKGNIIKGLKVFMIFIFAALFITIMITAKVKIGEVVCTDIQVNIVQEDELKFIYDKDILEYINNYGQELVINQKIKDIDKEEIEKRIEKNAYVANAEVFSNFEGSIRVNVTQKKPIYRVFNNNGVSYYVSNSGERIPFSSKFTPKLIVASGYLPDMNSVDKDSINHQILDLVYFIQKDEFRKAMIGQIYRAKNGDFILYPKIAEHKVILGSLDNLEEKFRYLTIFYKEAIKKIDWTKYESINLKYKGQIICTKKQ